MKLATNQDFGDWLNPMLVKELRQGLKTNVFVGVFVLIQVAMILLMGFRLLASGTAEAMDAGEWLDGVLWFSLGTTMLLIMPMRGLHSISEETKQNTLDLVQLTHLGALRIVTGKWIALIGQIGLLTMAVLPYAVLRYFFGGVDVVSNLTSLAMMMLSAAVVAATCIMLSTLPVVTRSVLSGMLFFMFFSSGFGFMIRTSLGGTAFGGTQFSPLAALVCTSLVIAFLLSLAASRIASPAENFSLILRGIAVVTALLALLALACGLRSDLWIPVACIIGGYSIFEALTERTSELPSLYAPIASRGPFGRLFGRFFYPGWATGILYTALITGLLFALARVELRPAQPQQLFVVWLFCFLAAIFPVPVLLLLRRVKQPGWFYFVLQGLGVVLYSIGRMVENVRGSSDALVAIIDSLTPVSVVLSMTSGWPARPGDIHWTIVPIMGLTIGGVMLIWLLIRARREFALIRRMEAATLAPSINASNS